MPYRAARGGWRIKRSYGSVAGVDVPAFNVAIGTDKEALARQVEARIDELPEWGIHGAALLLQIANKDVRPIDAYHTIKNKSVKDAPALIGSELLLDKWMNLLPHWKKKSGELLAVRTAHDYKQYISQLVEAFPDAKHKNLADALLAYRMVAMKDGHAAQYKKIKAACLSYARNTDGRHSDLWKAVSDVDGMATGEKRKINEAQRYYDALALIEKLPDDRMQKIAKQMLLTGMSVGEYVNDFEVLPDRIRIYGQKNKRRARDVPKLMEMEPIAFSYFQAGRGTIRNAVEGAPVIYKNFNAAVLKASDNKHTSNTFRHSYIGFLQKAKLHPHREYQYSGHRPPVSEQVHAGYTKTEETSFLMEDTEQLLKYLKGELKKPKEKKKKLVLLK